MHSKQLKIIIILFLFISTVCAQDVWINKISVDGPPKGACIGFSIYSTGYIGLGLDAEGYKRSLFAYSVFSEEWNKKESLGGAIGSGLNRGSAVAFVVNEKAYVGLGNGDNPFFRDFWEYDPLTDSWTQVADFGGTARRQAVAFSVDSFGYVGTGQDQYGLTNDFWKYNPLTNTWDTIAEFPGTPRKQAVGFSMGDIAYVGTGDDGVFTRDFWEYNTITDTWTEKAPFPGSPRYGAVGFSIYPDAYIATGYDSTLNYKKDVWVFNYWNQTWEQKDDFPGPARSNATAFVVNGKAYLGTGYNGNYLDDFYEFIPAVGILEIKKRVECMVYPNPSSNEFYINAPECSQKADIQIYNSNGSVVTKHFEIEKFGAYNLKLKIKSTQIPDGIYYLQISENEINIYYSSICIIK